MDIETASIRPWDLVIIGSGPNGAAIAHEVHRASPETSILVLESGRGMSTNQGEHLVESDEGALREAFETLMRRARQIEYVKNAGALLGSDDGWTPEGTGIFPVSYLGHEFTEFSGASFSWNVGGMGIHWAAASPSPYADEIPGFAGRDVVDDLQTAKRLLRVHPQAFTGNPYREPILTALRAAVPSDIHGRDAQDMPLAGLRRTGGGSFARTGPRDIAPELFDESAPHIALVPGTLATQILHSNGKVSAVVARDLATGTEREVPARSVVVAADTLRSPQILWASKIRPQALGLYLNEHVSIDGSVIVDGPKLGVSETKLPKPELNEPFVGAYWSPSIGAERPTHGQMMETFDDRGHRIGMSWYTSTDLRAENRIEFSDTDTDELGMPLMKAHFAYTDADRKKIEILRDVQRRAATAIGEFLPGDSETLAPGSSLHYTGTVRLGTADDGTSVASPDGQVWGFDNLFVAGNGAVPTALTCNSTLTGMTLSVRTARAVTRRISGERALPQVVRGAGAGY
jgi:choline dehydrogenase-like flavoprotein